MGWTYFDHDEREPVPGYDVRPDGKLADDKPWTVIAVPLRPRSGETTRVEDYRELENATARAWIENKRAIRNADPVLYRAVTREDAAERGV